MRFNRSNLWVFLILCFLVCGCGDQGEQSSKVRTIERIGVFIFPAYVFHIDWTDDLVDDFFSTVAGLGN